MFAVLVIKIRTKKVTSVVFIKNIKTNYIPAIGIFAFQMSIDVIIRKRRKLTTTCICRCKDTTFYLNTSINSKQNTLFQCEYFCFLTFFQVDNGAKITFFQDLKGAFSMIYSVFIRWKGNSGLCVFPLDSIRPAARRDRASGKDTS